MLLKYFFTFSIVFPSFCINDFTIRSSNKKEIRIPLEIAYFCKMLKDTHKNLSQSYWEFPENESFDYSKDTTLMNFFSFLKDNASFLKNKERGIIKNFKESLIINKLTAFDYNTLLNYASLAEFFNTKLLIDLLSQALTRKTASDLSNIVADKSLLDEINSFPSNIIKEKIKNRLILENLTQFNQISKEPLISHREIIYSQYPETIIDFDYNAAFQKYIIAKRYSLIIFDSEINKTEFNITLPEQIKLLACKNNCSWIAVAMNTMISFINIQDITKKRTIPAHQNAIHSLTISKDNKTLISKDVNNYEKIWDLDTAQLVSEQKIVPPAIHHVSSNRPMNFSLLNTQLNVSEEEKANIHLVDNFRNILLPLTIDGKGSRKIKVFNKDIVTFTEDNKMFEWNFSQLETLASNLDLDEVLLVRKFMDDPEIISKHPHLNEVWETKLDSNLKQKLMTMRGSFSTNNR